MAALNRLWRHIWEETNTNPLEIPGLTTYTKNPKRGINFFRRELKITILTYFGTMMLAIYGAKAEIGLPSEERSWIDAACLVFSAFYSLSMVLVKSGIYTLFSGLNVDMPVQQLRPLLVREFCRRIYTYNIKLTSINNSFNWLMVVFFVSRALFRIFDWSRITRGGMLVLIAAINIARHKVLTRNFASCFMDYNKFDTNPFDMQRIIVDTDSTEERERLKIPEECTICFVEIQKGDVLLDFGCQRGHLFHEECLSKWLDKKNSCPLCKQTIY